METLHARFRRGPASPRDAFSTHLPHSRPHRLDDRLPWTTGRRPGGFPAPASARQHHGISGTTRVDEEGVLAPTFLQYGETECGKAGQAGPLLGRKSPRESVHAIPGRERGKHG